MEAKKRERSANFNHAETQLLMSLVNRNKQIVENKKNDSVTNKHKEATWRKIEHCFNSYRLTTSVRSWKTLKLKYEGIKKAAKKKSFLQRQETYKTVEKPSNALEFVDSEEKVNICTYAEGLEASHDSDKIAKNDKLNTNTASTSSVPSKLGKLSAATSRLELLQLKIENSRKEHQFLKERHKLQILHLANEERRKQEIHELLLQKISRGSVSDGME